MQPWLECAWGELHVVRGEGERGGLVRGRGRVKVRGRGRGRG